MTIRIYIQVSFYLKPIKMVKVTFELKDELDERFRRAIADSKGLRKGVIGEALEEAIEAWIEGQARERAKKEK